MNTFTIPEGTKEVKIDQIDKKIIIEFIPQVEEVEPKDGDIIFAENEAGYSGICLFKKQDGVRTFCYFSLNFPNEHSSTTESIHYIIADKLRFATDSEKQLLFDKLAEQGFKWNAEEKNIEKIRWRAKKGEEYLTFNDLQIRYCTENNNEDDDRRYENGFYFKTKKQAMRAHDAVKNLLLNTEL